MSPILSVVVPTYNRKEMLGEALRGIMSQSLRDIEIIVVDDCSSDGTEEYVNSLTDGRIKYIRREKNTGVHYNYSLGLSNARGKYIVFHDDDDYYTDYDFFRKAVDIFAEHKNDTPPIVCVCSNAAIFNVDTRESYIIPRGKPGRVSSIEFLTDTTKKHIKPPSLFPTVFRTETLKQAGLADGFMDDSETYCYAMLYGDAWYISDSVGIYRTHSGSYTIESRPTPESDAKRYGVITERIRQRSIIYGRLCEIAGRESAKKYYVKFTYDILDFYGSQGKGYSDVFRICRIIIDASDFMPELKYILIRKWISGFPRRFSRRFEFMRRLYRGLKYSNAERIDTR